MTAAKDENGIMVLIPYSAAYVDEISLFTGDEIYDPVEVLHPDESSRKSVYRDENRAILVRARGP